MFTPLLSAFLSIQSWFRSGATLQVEILALGHQRYLFSRGLSAASFV
jgi:hypothetical protein